MWGSKSESRKATWIGGYKVMLMRDDEGLG